MDTQIARQLEDINKYIFVKEYQRAAQKLDKLIAQPEARNELLLHLRRMELALRLNTLPALLVEYETWAHKEPNNVSAAIALVMLKQLSEIFDAQQSILAYQNLLKTVGEHAAIYYGIALSLEMKGEFDRAIFNYERSLQLDGDWYPSHFGLSQLYYQKGENKRGDQYFLAFEQLAPFNVYGSFETHRRLYKEFFDAQQYDLAQTAVKTLSEWWLDHKGYCPPEIKLFELLSTRRIHEALDRKHLLSDDNHKIVSCCEEILADPSVKENLLYFAAKLLEDYGELQLALRMYRGLLKKESLDPRMIQKMGSQLLSMGEADLACQLFEEAIQHNPDNRDIRFCLLVSRLRLAGVSVEDYLIGKERIVHLSKDPSQRVELLSLLHSLLAKFDKDPDVYAKLAELNLQMGHIELAAKNFEKAYELDKQSVSFNLKYTSFLIQASHKERAHELILWIKNNTNLTPEQKLEAKWLEASLLSKEQKFDASNSILRNIMREDPWNVSFLVLYVYNELQEYNSSQSESDIFYDETITQLLHYQEDKLNWEQFEEISEALKEAGQHEQVYYRCKLHYLYTDGQFDYLYKLVHAAIDFDAQKAAYDFLRLLNTNFDHPMIYWCLGFLHKELGNHPVAIMWFEQAEQSPHISDEGRALCYVELADCLIWSHQDYQKALEYARLAMDLGMHAHTHAVNVLVHAYLKLGQVKEAARILSQSSGHEDFEKQFLQGLYAYRNGSRKEANELWKPLLTMRPRTKRMHAIQQEIFKYYYDEATYLPGYDKVQ